MKEPKNDFIADPFCDNCGRDYQFHKQFFVERIEGFFSTTKNQRVAASLASRFLEQVPAVPFRCVYGFIGGQRDLWYGSQHLSFAQPHDLSVHAQHLIDLDSRVVRWGW